MIVLEESKKQSLHESVDLMHSKVPEDVRNILSTNKKFKIAVAGKGTLRQYDEDAMQVIKEVPFNFSITNATAKIQKVRNEICPVISFTVGKDVFNIAAKKEWFLCYVNDQSGYPSDWALYAESTEVLDFIYTKTRTLEKETESLSLQMRVKHPDDERSDESAQPLPIFDFFSFNIQTL